MIFRRGKKDKEKEEEEEKKPKKKAKEEDELVWDKKRIAIILGLVLFLIIAGKEVKDLFFPDTNILGESTTITKDKLEDPDVDGPNLNLQNQLDTSIEDIKENIENIDPEDVASSSPQIQKVLKDIKSIKNLPTDKAKDACYNICSNL